MYEHKLRFTLVFIRDRQELDHMSNFLQLLSLTLVKKISNYYNNYYFAIISN